jgi:hypothetical protein
VPTPIFSFRNITIINSIKIPVIMLIVPYDILDTYDIPMVKASHGARPILALMLNVNPRE